MLKRIMHIFMLSSALLSAVSCNEELIMDGPVNDAIVLKLSSSETKAVQGTQTESYVHHLDVFIFKADSDNAKGERVHYKRYELNNSSSLTLECKRTEFAPEDRFYVYLVANASFSEEELAEQQTYYELMHNRQKDEYIHHCGLTSPNAPQYFLMDALATDETGSNPVRLNDGVLANSTLLTAELRRAAAKVEIKIQAGEHVTFTHFAGDVESEGGLYHIRNLPYDAFILSGETIYKESALRRNTMKGSSAYFDWKPETDDRNVTLIAYVYPHTWKDASILDYETCVIMNLPLVYKKGTPEEVVCKNSWFKIPMTSTSSFERNHYYGVNITLNRPGAAADSNPQTVDHIYYTVEEWTQKRVNVGGTTGPQYLQLNTDHVEMYNRNIDASTLEFASSSYIPEDGIELIEAYYYNYLDQRVNLSESDKYGIYGAISAKAQEGVLNGGITINSPFVKMSRQEMDAAIAALVKPTPVPEPPGAPAKVENPDNDATLNSIASKHSTTWARVEWRRNGDEVEFYRASGWSGNGYRNAQNEYDALKEEYDDYLVEYEKFVAANPEYAKYFEELQAYNEAVAAIEASSEDVHDNATRYLRFRVTNQTGQTAEFTVVQSPTLFIDNDMGHYSYRSDFGGTNYMTKGSPNRSGASWSNNSWTYAETASNSSFFGSKVAQANGSSYAIYYYYYNNRGRQLSNSSISSLVNPRMYHVHVTATSALYTVAIPKRDSNGYTESTLENSRLVSPSFMIASQLGATLSPSSKATAESHCAQYIEVTTDGREFDDWRLPTAAEIDIIINHQDVSDAMDVVLSGANYYCAYNTDSNGNVVYTKATGKSGTGVAVRCVRDVY